MSVRLFEMDENREVQLNKPWILLVPEFVKLHKRDKGSDKDYRGDKKLKFIKELTYIYFMEDFASPLRDWETAEKKKEALYYAGLDAKEIEKDKELEDARERYADIMLKSSRSLRTLKNLWKGLDAMDTQFASDKLFTATDKMGRPMYTVSDYATDTLKINKVYDAIKDFEKRVEEDLKQAPAGIRGPNSTLGDLEGTKRTWAEADIREGSAHSGGPKSSADFAGMMNAVNGLNGKGITKLAEIENGTIRIFDEQEEDEE